MAAKRSSQVILQEGEFYTIAAPNGKVLEVANYNMDNGAAIPLWDYAGHPWQQWTFVESGDGEYRIKNRFTGKVIDLMMSGVVEGTWLHQWARNSGASQRWKLEETRGGRVRIRSVLANKCIDLVGLNTRNGARAQIWLDVQGGNQEWKLTRVDIRETDAVPMQDLQAKAAEAHRRRQAEMVEKIGGKNSKGKKK